jgi:Ohr subfamily peroxiredoxin
MFIRSSAIPLRARQISKRFLNTETAPALYTAHANISGGRNGHAEGDEGLKVDLTMPKALGGSSGTGKTNPEELFAAGYGACFQSAMGAVAPGLKIALPEKAEDCIVDSKVSLVGDFNALDLGLRVDMEVKARGIKKEDLEKVVAKAKEVCPYSRATSGNVATKITVSML